MGIETAGHSRQGRRIDEDHYFGTRHIDPHSRGGRLTGMQGPE